MRLRFYGAIILLTGSLVLSLLLLMFTKRISSVVPISPEVTSYIGGTLLVGFYEGLGMIRELLKERDERRLKHSTDLRECLQEWSVINLQKDTALPEPSSRWLDEVKEHFTSVDDRHLIMTPGFQPLNLTLRDLWSMTLGYSEDQRRFAEKIREKLAISVDNQIKAVNDDFRNAEGIHISGVTRYYFKNALIDYVYRAMDNALKLEFVLTTDGRSALSESSGKGLVDSPSLDELEKIRDSLLSRLKMLNFSH